MSKGAHGDLAADAAAYLRKGAGTVQSVRGSAQEIRRQMERLAEWAKERKVVLGADYTLGLEKKGFDTSEHEVYYRKSDNRAVKCTFPGSFGYAHNLTGKPKPATPLFYIERLRLMNSAFHADFRLEGVAFGRPKRISAKARQLFIIVSQEWIDAVDEKDPHPSEEEIAAFMISERFDQLDAFRWFRPSDRLLASDTKTDNFIKSSQGVIPIDLILATIIPES